MKTYIFLAIFCFLMFSHSVMAVKIIYPNDISLPTKKSDVTPNIFGGMNEQQVQIIKNNLDETSQTLDAQKLSESIKEKNIEDAITIKQSNNLLWIFILFLVIILICISIIRFFRKDEK